MLNHWPQVGTASHFVHVHVADDTTLLAHFGTLDALLARVEEVPYLRMRATGQVYVKLKAHREQALLSRTLSVIALDAPIPTA